jgi:polysaccharide pyruvyl transferase WcaK-like protein
MENPKNWPPNNNINPLFISFHINPSIVKTFINHQSIEYFKKHEPIGCRDYYTRDLLVTNGINAYFSSCVTLGIEREKYLKRQTPGGVLVIGAFDRLKPYLDYKSPLKFLLSLIKYPLRILNYKIKLQKFNRHLYKQKFEIKSYSQITKNSINSHSEGIALAEEMLNKIAESDIIITSRIHAALPALAMGLKVIFIDEGLDHTNHKMRLSGLKHYFKTVHFKDFFMINLEDVKNMENHNNYIQNIKQTINKFKTQ